jgi:serine phosphatase RsbU (regulator of sigma subunit)
MVVGALADASYVESRARLRPGDLLLAYTDGITEARGEDRGLLGPEGVRAIVTERHRAGSAGAEDIVSHLYGAVVRFCAGRLEDDATLLGLRRLPA